MLRPYSDWNMGAMLFAPVRFLSMNRCDSKAGEEHLAELIQMLQKLLLY